MDPPGSGGPGNGGSAGRLEGQSLPVESLAVALQGKSLRLPPTPSPASKATLALAQEGPSKAAAIEEDSSETDELEFGGR